MSQAGIAAIDCYLPQRILANAEIAKQFPEWDPKRAERITGVRERRVEPAETPASDMALQAARNLLDNYNIPKETIDFVIVITQSGDYVLPATACILQHKLGLSTSTGAMDVNLGCSAYVYGLATAKGLVESGAARNVLLVTVEKTSFAMHPEDITLKVLQGDAATATLVSKENVFADICAMDFGTDGSGYDNIIVPCGGSAEIYETKQPQFAEFPHPHHVNMKGMNIFNFSVSAVPKTLTRCLEKNGLSLDEIDHFVFHQANKIILDTIGSVLKIPREKIQTNIETVGNTSSCSIPLLLCDMKNQGALKPQDRVMLCGFGVGLSWSSAVLKVVS